jgi:ABC-type transport system involved in cytochrome c biogenesis permease subunit
VVWANEAWGAYWSWDPRNVGIDHMVSVSIYLHSRLLKKARAKAAALGSCGFFVI